MNETKSVWTSKTIWGGLVALAANLMRQFGFEISPDMEAELTNTVLQLVEYVGILLVLVGRLTAKKTVTL